MHFYCNNCQIFPEMTQNLHNSPCVPQIYRFHSVSQLHLYTCVKIKRYHCTLVRHIDSIESKYFPIKMTKFTNKSWLFAALLSIQSINLVLGEFQFKFESPTIRNFSENYQFNCQRFQTVHECGALRLVDV